MAAEYSKRMFLNTNDYNGTAVPHQLRIA